MFFTLIALAQGAWFMGYKVSPNYYRNGIVEGFAFFMLGQFIHETEGKIVTGNKVLVGIIILSSIFCIVERFLCNRVFVVHLCTYPQVICLFIYAIKNSQSHAGLVQMIGKYCSMYIYIFHMLVWNNIDRLSKWGHVDKNMIFLCFRPLIVLGIALLMSMACHVFFNSKRLRILLRQ